MDLEYRDLPHFKPKQYQYNAQIHVTYKKRLFQLRDGKKPTIPAKAMARKDK